MNKEQIEKLREIMENYKANPHDAAAIGKWHGAIIQAGPALVELAERTTAPVSLTDDDLTQEFSLDAIIKGIRYADHGRHEGWQAELKECIRIECNRAILAAAPAPIQQASPVPLFDRKLADLQQRGYEVIGRILHKNGEYALFDSSCRWLTKPQYQRLMHEQDGSLFATPPALAGSQVQAAGDARYKWLANRVLACDYGDNDTKQIGWRLRQESGPIMFGESIDVAIDAAMREQP